MTREEYYKASYNEKRDFGYPKEYSHLLAKRDAARYVLNDLKQELYKAVLEERDLTELCNSIRKLHKELEENIKEANEYAKENNI